MHAQAYTCVSAYKDHIWAVTKGVYYSHLRQSLRCERRMQDCALKCIHSGKRKHPNYMHTRQWLLVLQPESFVSICDCVHAWSENYVCVRGCAFVGVRAWVCVCVYILLRLFLANRARACAPARVDVHLSSIKEAGCRPASMWARVVGFDWRYTVNISENKARFNFTEESLSPSTCTHACEQKVSMLPEGQRKGEKWLEQYDIYESNV